MSGIVPRGAPNTELALVFPIQPGLAEAVEHLGEELGGARAVEFHRSQQALGIRQESWFLHRLPERDLVTVYLETRDVGESLGKLVASRSPFDLWLKGEVRRVTGVDVSSPASVGVPKQILRYRP